MPRPSTANLTKAQNDLSKVTIKLNQIAGTLAMLCNDPMGSDMEICKQIRAVENSLRQSSMGIRDVSNDLDGPMRTLANRKRGR